LPLRADLPLRACPMALSLGRGRQVARRGGPLAGIFVEIGGFG
jgi:hypothetical protein